MRFVMKVSLPVETANAAAKSGKLAKTIQAIVTEQKPEAAYFTEFDGRRTGLIVLDIAEPSQIPAVAEPWFLAFNAAVEFHPAMVAADLAKAAPAIEKAAKTYGV